MRQAASVTQDDSNNMTAHNSIDASNSRNESNIRTANKAGTPTIAGMLGKVMKPATACRDDNNYMDTINEMAAAAVESQQHSAGTPATAAETLN